MLLIARAPASLCERAFALLAAKLATQRKFVCVKPLFCCSASLCSSLERRAGGHDAYLSFNTLSRIEISYFILGGVENGHAADMYALKQMCDVTRKNGRSTNRVKNNWMGEIKSSKLKYIAPIENDKKSNGNLYLFFN